MTPADAKIITVVACGHCGVRFATAAPRDFIVRVRRCGECGEPALAIDHYEQPCRAARAQVARTGGDGQEAPSR
jgi:hypothetical protein